MRIVILPDAKSVSQRAADIFCALIVECPDAVLGLATGSTPLATYNELVRRNRAGEISFAQITTFNLDEYVGLKRQHSQSYYSFMHQNFFSLVDINPGNCFLPEGEAEDLVLECQHYEELIDEVGGIDLQVLGIGTDGHIAFNEPGSSLASRTRIKALTEQTRIDNSRFFNSIDEVPRVAITMGVGTILEADHVLLLATGESKASAVRDFVEGPITSMVPASALQLHPKVTVLLDTSAASQLTRRDYYDYVERIQADLESR
jgi:glucosamine-6-phosphate deaminase